MTFKLFDPIGIFVRVNAANFIDGLVGPDFAMSLSECCAFMQNGRQFEFVRRCGHLTRRNHS